MILLRGQRVQPLLDELNNAIQHYMQKSRFILAVLAIVGAQGCVHQTAMMDPALHSLWSGNPVPEPVLQAATLRHKQDVSLIEMQQAFALLRKGELLTDDRNQAKRHLEKAVASFDDLKEPNNFSTAFTIDSNTPYRGRPYERVLASTMLGILDIADGRCDMALPAFKTAEFLDARWQPFQFGSDAPLVYALSLRCLKQVNASQGDITRAKDGLFRSIRLNQALETVRDTLQEHARDLAQQELPSQIAFLLIDAGISSALMEAPADADASSILDKVVTDSLRFYVQVLSDKNDPLFESVSKYAKREPSAQSLLSLTNALTNALNSLVAKADTVHNIKAKLSRKLAESREIADAVSVASMQPKATLIFEGVGPKIRSEGEYKQIARILPSSEESARPGTALVTTHAHNQCGFHQEGNTLTIVMCDERMSRSETSSFAHKQDRLAAKLWSSSYQATSMVGRRFDMILKGRAEFRLGAEQTALIGGVTSLALLEAGSQLQRDCDLYGKNCESARNMQLAGAVAGVIAGGAWLAGHAVNPEADTRHLTNTFESGYLVISKK